MSFAIREPSAREIRETFGSAKRCLEITKGDLPTILHFLSNPDKLAGFKAPKSARRVGYASYAKRLRQMVYEDRKADRDKAIRELAALVEQRLTATWSDGRPVHDCAKPLRIQTLLSEVSRMPWPAGLRLTRKTIAEAVGVINKKPGRHWILPATRPKRNTPAARDRAMRGVRR